MTLAAALSLTLCTVLRSILDRASVYDYEIPLAYLWNEPHLLLFVLIDVFALKTLPRLIIASIFVHVHQHRHNQHLLLLLFVFVTCRVVAAIVFTRGTGWYIPSLFFHSSGYEPIHFGHLVILTLCVQHVHLHSTRLKARNLNVSKLRLESASGRVTDSEVRSWTLVLSTGLLMFFMMVSDGGVGVWSMMSCVLAVLLVYQTRALNALWVMGRGGVVAVVVFKTFLFFQLNHFPTSFSSSTLLRTLFHHAPTPPLLPSIPFKYWVTMVVLTAPRMNDADHLEQVMETTSKQLHSLDLSIYDSRYPHAMSPNLRLEPVVWTRRIRWIVFTHFSNHSAFDRAEFASTDPIEFVQFDGDTNDHRMHLTQSLKIAMSQPSMFYGVVEDDFPWCHQGLSTCFDALVQSSTDTLTRASSDTSTLSTPPSESICGVFCGTGGR